MNPEPDRPPGSQQHVQHLDRQRPAAALGLLHHPPRHPSPFGQRPLRPAAGLPSGRSSLETSTRSAKRGGIRRGLSIPLVWTAEPVVDSRGVRLPDPAGRYWPAAAHPFRTPDSEPTQEGVSSGLEDCRG